MQLSQGQCFLPHSIRCFALGQSSILLRAKVSSGLKSCGIAVMCNQFTKSQQSDLINPRRFRTFRFTRSKLVVCYLPHFTGPSIVRGGACRNDFPPTDEPTSRVRQCSSVRQRQHHNLDHNGVYGCDGLEIGDVFPHSPPQEWAR